MALGITRAIDLLAKRFATYDWTYRPEETGIPGETYFRWFGRPDETIMVMVLKDVAVHEHFHRHGFFFYNFAYQGDYEALSARPDNLITIREGECYVGQPHTGYALRPTGEHPYIVVGVLIQREAFVHEFLPTLAYDDHMLQFFLKPETNQLSDEAIHLRFGEDESRVRALLNQMIIEYAKPKFDTQAILKPMALALMMQVARAYRANSKDEREQSLSARVLAYVAEQSDAPTLAQAARHFSYHPNYLSTLIRKETGRTFTELVCEQRMERAETLLRETSLSVEEIAQMLGYRNSSNFYRAFKAYYGTSPRSLVGALSN